MLILDSQQVEYCKVVRKIDSKSEAVEAIAYQDKLFVKIKSYNLDERPKAIAKAKEIFLKYKGQVLFVLLEEPRGFTLWYQDKHVKRVDADKPNLKQLLVQMRGEEGIAIKDRWYGLHKYSRCFVGSEAVTWLCQRLDISREEAVRLGQKLLVKKKIHHVLDEHPFLDANFFYRFYEDE